MIITRNTLEQRLDTVDRAVTVWMARNSLPLLRIGLGIVFLWFGALKFVPGLSPADALVRNSVPFVNPDWFIPVLALWEVAIGLGLIFGLAMRVTLLLLFLQMPGTLLPLVSLPEAVWTQFPFGLTLEGQYIIKNMVLVAAGMVLAATVRGGYIEPLPARQRGS